MKLTPEDRIRIGQTMAGTKITYQELADAYGVSRRSIQNARDYYRRQIDTIRQAHQRDLAKKGDDHA